MRAMATLRGILTLGLLATNTIFWCAFLFPVALLKLLPVPAWRVRLSRVLVGIAELWADCNRGILALTQNIRWDVAGLEGLERDRWYLVIANHASWVDILVLQTVLNRRIPFLKFFLKRELIRVPLLGLAWWALDFPFMRRHGSKYLEQHPEARGEDLEATRRACEKFRTSPVSIMNFVEGTRRTPARQQGSSYRNLLKPRAGGVAFVLGAMGGMLHALLDVTIVYPAGTPTFWGLCSGRIPEIVVRIHHHDIPDWAARGDYQGDARFRGRFKLWLRDLWIAKDAEIDDLLTGARAA